MPEMTLLSHWRFGRSCSRRWWRRRTPAAKPSARRASIAVHAAAWRRAMPLGHRLEQGDSAAMLQRLEQSDLLVVALDEGRPAYSDGPSNATLIKALRGAKLHLWDGCPCPALRRLSRMEGMVRLLDCAIPWEIAMEKLVSPIPSECWPTCSAGATSAWECWLNRLTPLHRRPGQRAHVCLVNGAGSASAAGSDALHPSAGAIKHGRHMVCYKESKPVPWQGRKGNFLTLVA
ncbi:hypothetical protein [Cupriavidus necator]|uniref:hypothetical protein n=1 Tax=Cupriavidus necator TaxID=106590 RepID=UPI0012D36BAB|nr:hypothetical protein [Cupriavidus necator]